MDNTGTGICILSQVGTCVILLLTSDVRHEFADAMSNSNDPGIDIPRVLDWAMPDGICGDALQRASVRTLLGSTSVTPSESQYDVHSLHDHVCIVEYYSPCGMQVHTVRGNGKENSCYEHVSCYYHHVLMQPAVPHPMEVERWDGDSSVSLPCS